MIFNLYFLLSICLTGSCVTFLAYAFSNWMCDLWETSEIQEDFQSASRVAIRKQSLTMRTLEPVVDLLQLQIAQNTWLPRLLGSNLVDRCIGRGGSNLNWKPLELIAVRLLESFLLACSVCCLMALFGRRNSAIVYSFMFGGIYFYGSHLLLHLKASSYMTSLKQRLPYGVDLIAIMMQTGEPFHVCLETVSEVNEEHPLGLEFRRVIGQHEAGKPLGACLETMSQRLRDGDIEQIVDATINSDELGTPLSDTYLRLADQMRLRRSQRAEEAAGRAQAKIVLPGFIVMVACMIIVVAPFVLQAFSLTHEFSATGG